MQCTACLVFPQGVIKDFERETEDHRAGKRNPYNSRNIGKKEERMCL